MEDYSPLFQWDTATPFDVRIASKNGSALNLMGATFTMKMINEVGVVKICSPSAWTIYDAVNGKARYQWQYLDVDTPGTWTLYVCVTIGGLSLHADPKLLEVLPSP